MNHPARYDPFDATLQPFDELVRSFLRPARAAEVRGALQAPLDVHDRGDRYEVRVNLPGMKREDIHVTVDGNQVTISAETLKEVEEKDDKGKVLHQERHQGKIYRSIALPQEMDPDRSGARYEDGVLLLDLPKKEAATQKRLTIG